MLVKRCGGMIEFIPSPSEKRDGVIRNHVLDLLANLHDRLQRLEKAAGMSTDLADEFADTLARIQSEETQVALLNEMLLSADSQAALNNS